MTIIPVSSFETSDLVVDAVYERRPGGGTHNDPLYQLMKVGNSGGFRPVGRRRKQAEYKYVVLYSSRDEPEWPDYLDMSTGTYTYYGDIRESGKGLEQPLGNAFLSRIFKAIHMDPPNRKIVPPIFVFEATAEKHMRFLGLAVPGAAHVPPVEQLVAIWKYTGRERFQNYKAVFTILNTAPIPRAWLEELSRGEPFSANCPPAWKKWVDHGTYTALTPTPTLISTRRKRDQLPDSPAKTEILQAIIKRFEGRQHDFEHVAIRLAHLADPNILDIVRTRPVQDGGRDGIGTYRIGPNVQESLYVDIALEAKCFDPGKTSVTTKHTSRLISRLRHRQFGIFVTTSYVAEQAFKEVREDDHPILFICGRDIVDLLDRHGYKTLEQVISWLSQDGL